MQDFNEKAPTEGQIRKTLEDFEAPHDPSAWAIFEQKLNAKYTDEIPEAVAEVDKIVYPKIAKFEADFSSKNWAIMADRLQLISVRKRQVWSSKLIESAIFLLLVANLPAWLGLAPEPKKRIFIPKNEAVAALEQPSDRHEKTSSKKVAFEPEKASSEASVLLQKMGIDGAAADGFLAAASTLFGFPAEAVLEAPLAFFDAAFSAEKMDEKSPDGPASNGQKSLFPPLAFASENESDFETQLIENEQVTFKKDGTRPALFAPFSARELQKIDGPKRSFLPLEFVAEKRKKRRFQLAAFASPQLNYVETIAAKSDGMEQFQQLSTGYGGGVTFGSKKGRWGVESGLVYQAKNFDASVATTVAGNFFDQYVSISTEKVELEEVAVPIHLTCQIGRLGKTKMTAVAGNSLQLVAQKNLVRRATTVDPDGILAKRAFADAQRNEGLFEGGRFEKNAALTADLGLRLERPIGSSRFAVFVQPMAQMPVGAAGFGDQKARITSFSLRAGVISTL